MVSRDNLTDESSEQLESLQLSAEPMRTWVGDGKGGRTRPVMCVVMARHSRMCLGMDLAPQEEAPFDVAARVLTKTLKAARIPSNVHVQVRDPELATALLNRAELADIDFEVVERLDAVDFMMEQMQDDLFPKRVESLLDQKGMTIERLRAFADGCVLFYAARPWRHLHDDDLIEIQTPKPPAGMACASILGAGGRMMGIGFFANVKSHEKLMNAQAPQKQLTRTPRWSLMFNAPDELPPEDADLWQEHGLRVTTDEAVPQLLCFHGATKVQRPDGATLTFVEGLCRAIAATTEAEIDAGRWEKTVRTIDGPVRYELTIPHLLQTRPAEKPVQFGRASMERSMQQIARMIQNSGAKSIEEMNALLASQVHGKTLNDPAPAETATERAQDLCHQAEEARSRRELQLLREALRLDPNCADAYILLARRESDPAEAEKQYRQATEAGRRSLDEAAFKDPGYPFWGVMESRPFMRAMAGLCDVVGMQGRIQESAELMREMLRLNPGDNQGIRYRYVPRLIELDQLDAAREVIESKDYRDDICAMWDFAAALIAFKQGRHADADLLLKRAVARNRFVAPLVLEVTPMPAGSDSWSPGTASEGAMVADLLIEAWHSDEEALLWLAKSTLPPRPAGKKSKGKGKRKGK